MLFTLLKIAYIKIIYTPFFCIFFVLCKYNKNTLNIYVTDLKDSTMNLILIEYILYFFKHAYFIHEPFYPFFVN